MGDIGQGRRIKAHVFQQGIQIEQPGFPVSINQLHPIDGLGIDGCGQSLFVPRGTDFVSGVSRNGKNQLTIGIQPQIQILGGDAHAKTQCGVFGAIGDSVLSIAQIEGHRPR